jgi:uncharacterized protein YecE (DUF72 family)
MRRTNRIIYVGTAGWAISSLYKDALPGSGTHLERYARRLNAVEINSSFYRHHQRKTYLRWAASAPSNFRFSLKIPRTLTHEGELTPDAAILDRFIEEVQGLGDRLGVILVQLPPKLPFDEPTAKRFFGALRKRIDVQLACEPRHPSWGVPRADSLLADWDVARVAADPAPWPGADQPGGSGSLVYFRWHGQPRKYYSDYDDRACMSLRDRLLAARTRAAQVWAIFDNTALGYALGNALTVTDALTRDTRPSAESRRQSI